MSKIRRIILETAVEKLIEFIKDTLKGKKEYKGRYSLPYSDSNDDMVDFIITYHVTKVKLWKTLTPQFSCVFEGTIYISIDNVSVGFEGTDDWETAHIHDLPSWVEEDFKYSIEDELKIFPICVDVDYDKVS